VENHSHKFNGVPASGSTKNLVTVTLRKAGDLISMLGQYLGLSPVSCPQTWAIFQKPVFNIHERHRWCK